MAPRLKYSVVLIAACIVTALWIQLSKPYVGSQSIAERAAMLKRQELSREAMDAQRLHREYVLGDSLIARLPDSVGGVVAEQPAYAAEPVAELQRLVASQLVDAQPVRARIGVFLHDVTSGFYAGSQMKSVAYPGRMYFMGSDAKGPYCVSAVSMPTARVNRSVSTNLRYQRNASDVLGPCAFWARYGAPGDGVERWLRQGGYYFASSTRPRPEPLVEPYPEKPFGIRWDHLEEVDGFACRAGDENRCVDALRRHVDTTRHSFAVFRHARELIAFGSGETGLVAEMERQFGHAQFAKFWQSSADLEPAFAQAFGVPAGEWVRQWAQQHHGVETRGPRMAGFSIALTLFAALVLAGFSVAMASRREVQ